MKGKKTVMINSLSWNCAPKSAHTHTYNENKILTLCWFFVPVKNR